MIHMWVSQMLYIFQNYPQTDFIHFTNRPEKHDRMREEFLPRWNFQQRSNKVGSWGRCNHKDSPDSAPVNKAWINHQSLFSLPVRNPVSWLSAMPTDLVGQILLPVSDAGIPAAKAC